MKTLFTAVFFLTAIFSSAQEGLEKVKMDVGVVGGDVSIYEVYNSHLEDVCQWEVAHEKDFAYLGNSEVTGDFRLYLDTTLTFIISTFEYEFKKNGKVKSTKLLHNYIVRFIPGRDFNPEDKLYCFVEVKQDQLEWTVNGEMFFNEPTSEETPNILELTIN